jgi:hypothetical protein
LCWRAGCLQLCRTLSRLVAPFRLLLQVATYLFAPFALLTGIPVFSIIIRYKCVADDPTWSSVLVLQMLHVQLCHGTVLLMVCCVSTPPPRPTLDAPLSHLAVAVSWRMRFVGPCLPTCLPWSFPGPWPCCSTQGECDSTRAHHAVASSRCAALGLQNLRVCFGSLILVTATARSISTTTTTSCLFAPLVVCSTSVVCYA